MKLRQHRRRLMRLARQTPVPYYVVNRSANSFQVTTRPGGIPIALSASSLEAMQTVKKP